MTDPTNGRQNDRSAARQARLRAALRENLKRRKLQSRGRADQTATVESDAPENPDRRQSREGSTE